jgi:acyl-CoA synthetase (AMP-forming)/AMP-acid ligase II
MPSTPPAPPFNPPTNPLYDGCTVGDLLVRAIARGGDRPAFIGDDTQWSYRQLGALVSTVVQALAARGLQRGDAVATLSANRPEAFLITAAAYLMGLRLTWLNPTSSEDDHAYILADSGVTTLFVDPHSFSQRALALAARVPGLQKTCWPLRPPTAPGRCSRRPCPTTCACWSTPAAPPASPRVWRTPTACTSP